MLGATAPGGTEGWARVPREMVAPVFFVFADADRMVGEAVVFRRRDEDAAARCAVQLFPLRE